jgi:hypothetical protein
LTEEIVRDVLIRPNWMKSMRRLRNGKDMMIKNETSVESKDDRVEEGDEQEREK